VTAGPLSTKLAWHTLQTQLTMEDMSAQLPAFSDDLARDLQSRRFRTAYRRASLRIAVVDLTVNALRRLSLRQVRGG
jgi:hypothetical protein